MKTASNITVGAKPSRAARPANEIVERAHQRLLQFIASRNAETQDANAVIEKLGVHTPRASAYIPCLLAQPFGVTEQFIVEEASFANLCLDFFSRAVDFCTDNPKKSEPTFIHLSSLCLGKAAQIYGNLLPRADGFWKYWEQYLQQASESERFLWRHQASIVPFSKVDFAMLGTKSAVVKISAAFYASTTGRWEILGDIEKGLNATATGVQIVDDLLDWEEDLQVETNTFPLMLAREQLQPGQSMAQAVDSPAVVIPVLRRAVDSLALGRQHFERIRANSFVAFIDALLNDIEDAERYVQRSRAHAPARPRPHLIKHLRRMITPRLAH